MRTLIFRGKIVFYITGKEGEKKEDTIQLIVACRGVSSEVECVTDVA